jgi:hypothetical protein
MACALSARMTRFVHRMKSRPFRTYRELERQDAATRIIQKHWKVAIANPSYKLCRNRLYNEFTTLVILLK